ncbi:hypothetical protein ZIOFF_002640 [Zingiber officinale]|uniref:P-type ATPase A domain-containing protein n=1 Tax=Zingiber officinale TaxID=94328 RepID=A0A8J5I5F7_ZINOF|nr:hypothetical protein ZIOFF_002640 [Zingiber officinale]
MLQALGDGCRIKQDVTILVPDDIISIKLGDIVRTYAQLLEGDALKIDQSALTREYLPVTKNPGDEEFSTIGVHIFFDKVANPVDSPNQVGHFQKILTDIVNLCICIIATYMVVESIFMYPIQHRRYRDEINNLLVLLIGGIPILMSTVLSVTVLIGSHRLSQQGAITKRMTGVDKEHVILLTIRASRTNNQDAIEVAVILSLCNCKEVVKNKVPAVIDKYAERGFQSLVVARQEVPEKHDSKITIRRALNLGVNVKMITGDQLTIAKETGKRLRMGKNMYPSSSLLGQNKDRSASLVALTVDELIEKVGGFEGVFPGDGVNDAPAFKKADIDIVVTDAIDATRSASDIILIEPGLSLVRLAPPSTRLEGEACDADAAWGVGRGSFFSPPPSSHAGKESLLYTGVAQELSRRLRQPPLMPPATGVASGSHRCCLQWLAPPPAATASGGHRLRRPPPPAATASLSLAVSVASGGHGNWPPPPLPASSAVQRPPPSLPAVATTSCGLTGDSSVPTCDSDDSTAGTHCLLCRSDHCWMSAIEPFYFVSIKRVMDPIRSGCIWAQIKG